MSPPARRLLAVWLTVMALSAPVAAGPAAPPAGVAEALRASALRHAQVGVLIRDLGARRTLFERNADLMLVPASNMKLVTSACALQTLGPSRRLETAVLYTGTLRAGVLTGNLYLRGGGDPALDDKGIEELARQVRQAGVRELRGNLIGDDSLFDPERYAVGWAIDDEGEDYAMPVGALGLNRNVVRFQVLPAGLAGSPPLLQVVPPLAVWTVVNEATTVARGGRASIRVERDRVLPLYRVRGQLPLGSSAYTEAKSVVDPAEYALQAFAEQLLAAGVDWQGGVGYAAAPQGATRLAAHASPTLAELVRYMNKESDNYTAEVLLRLLGARPGQPGTPENGAEAVQRWLAGLGGDETALIMHDGSGLSRRDFVTPRNLMRVLEAMAAGPHAAAFRDSLPVAGVDGTLASRLRGTAAEGRLRAKTGTMSQVSALSGYLRTASGRDLAVVIIFNGYYGKAGGVRAAQDQLVARLAAL